MESYDDIQDLLIQYIEKSIKTSVEHIVTVVRTVNKQRPNLILGIVEWILASNHNFDLLNVLSSKSEEIEFLSILCHDRLPKESVYKYEKLFSCQIPPNTIRLYYSDEFSLREKLLFHFDSNWVENFIYSDRISQRLIPNRITKLANNIALASNKQNKSQAILNVHDFPTWILKIKELKELSQISMTLSDLNKSAESRVLLRQIISTLSPQYLASKCVGLKLDKISIALRELHAIDESISTSVSQKIWYEPTTKESLSRAFKYASIGEITKALSEIRFFDIDYSIEKGKELMDNGVIKKALFSEKNFTKSIHAIQELLIHQSLSTKGQELVTSYLSSETFKQIFENNFTKKNIALYNRLISNEKYNLPNSVNFHGTKSTIDILSSVAENDFDLNSFVKKNRTTKLRDKIHELNRIDSSRTRKSFNDLCPSEIVKSLRKYRIRINQSTELLLRLKSQLKKSSTVNCNPQIFKILKHIISDYNQNKQRRNKIDLTSYVTAFSFSLTIEKTLTIQELENEFLERLKQSHIGSTSIGKFLQMISRILKVEPKYLTHVKKFIVNNQTMIKSDVATQNLSKSVAGIIELAKTEIAKNEAIDILDFCQDVIIHKVKSRKNEVTSYSSILMGLKIVDDTIENRISNNIIASM